MAEFTPCWVKDKPKQENEFKSKYAPSLTFGHRIYDRYDFDERNEYNGFRRIRYVDTYKNNKSEE